VLTFVEYVGCYRGAVIYLAIIVTDFTLCKVKLSRYRSGQQALEVPGGT
jgi:hypothetical protein